jgi:hypothetical protein
MGSRYYEINECVPLLFGERFTNKGVCSLSTTKPRICKQPTLPGGKSSASDWLSLPPSYLRLFIYLFIYSGGPRFDSQQRQYLSLLHSIQAGSGAHPASCRIGTRCSFLGGKAGGGVKLNHSSPFTSIWCRIQEGWSYTSIPPYIFMT